MRVFYFGCYNSIGHKFYSAGGLPMSEKDWEDMPWKYSSIDGTYAPAERPRKHVVIPEPDGVCKLYHHRGWTMVAFWDKSFDSRTGSNSVFIVEGEYKFSSAISRAKSVFPEIFRRFNFELVEKKD